MGWWDEKASLLHHKVLDSETEGFGDTHTDEVVRKAIVHTRQDVVLIASQLSSLNQQIWTLKLLGGVIAALLFWIATKLT